MSLAPTVSVQKFSNYRNLLIFLALIYFVKVLSVGAGDFRAYYHAGTKVTEATFEEFDGSMSELGKAKITEGGSHSAFIKGVKTAVSIGRS